MHTFDTMHKDCRLAGQPCAYWGDYGDWLCVLGQSRDSDTLEQSNFQVACDMLEALGPECYQIERENHWAVGWVETLLVNPNNPQAVALAEMILEKIEGYPILDEQHYSELEHENYVESWDNWGRSEFQNKLGNQYDAYPKIAEGCRGETKLGI